MTRSRSFCFLLFALVAAAGIVVLSSRIADPAGAANGDVRFAVLGDFGSGSSNQQAVADMIDGQNVEFIATVGDNVYSSDNADPATAIANKVTAFYGDWMDDGTFYPLLGNHDWGDPGVPLLQCPGDTNSCTGAWFDAFELPGNERYYSVRQGAVEVFVYSDYYLDPDFNWQDRPNSPMTLWLREGAGELDRDLEGRADAFPEAPVADGHGGATGSRLRGVGRRRRDRRPYPLLRAP